MAPWDLLPLFCFQLVWFQGVFGDVQGAAISLSIGRSSAALKELLHDVSIGKGFPVIDLSARGGFDSVNATTQPRLSELCRSHLIFYEAALTSFEEQWALTMLDASTKIPGGLLVGSWTDLGNFDECIGVRDVQTDMGVFHGQYCLASLSVDPSTRGLESRRQQRPADIGEHNLELLEAMTLKVAVCVPSSCSANDTALFMKQTLDYLGEYLNFTLHFNVEVSELECHTQDEPSLQPEDWAAVGILSFFAVLVVLSTAYDVLQRNAGSRNNLLLAFSVYSNGKKLFATSSTGDTLHAVHGIRFLSIAWVMLGHRYEKSANYPNVNSLEFLSDIVSDWQNLILSNAALSVDTFFVLSGLLVSYVFFKQAPKMKSFNIPMFYIHRYIRYVYRLTPPFALMALLQATLLRYSGSGPIWDSVSHEQHQSCQDNWWAALLYVHIYVESLHLCVDQTWYLAVDMQLHWLSPIVLIPLWKWPKIGAGVVSALCVGGLIGNYFISYNNEFPATLLTLHGEQTHPYMQNLYYPVYTRFIPYLLGVALGYLLVNLKTKGTKLKFSTAVTLLLWLFAAAMMLLSLCIVQIFQEPDYVFEPVGPAFYNALGRPVWSLGLVIIIFLCSTGHGGYPNTLLSWEWWQPLSRLSYSLYLVHISIQLSQYGSVRTVGYLANIGVVHQFFGDLVLSILLATILSLVFESPFIILEKELLGGKKQPQRQNPLASTATPEQGQQGEKNSSEGVV